MEIQIKYFQNINKTQNAKNTSHLNTSDQERYNNLQHHVFNNNTKLKTIQQYFNYNT